MPNLQLTSRVSYGRDIGWGGGGGACLKRPPIVDKFGPDVALVRG